MTLLAASLLIGVLTVLALVLSPILVRTFARMQLRRAGFHLEALGHISDIAGIETLTFYKHRTITTGNLVVVSVDPFTKEDEQDLRWFAGALEHHAAHPIGRAISKLAGRGNVSNVLELPQGISGSVDRHPVRVGQPQWLGCTSCETDFKTVAVEVDQRTMGTITVADEIASTSKKHLAQLRDTGVTPKLVSTEPESVAKDLASRVGIDLVHDDQNMTSTAATTCMRMNESSDEVAIDQLRFTLGDSHPLDIVIRAIQISRAVPKRVMMTQVTIAVVAALAFATAILLF